MMPIRSFPRLLPAVAVLTLAACAGEGAPAADGQAGAADSAAQPIPRVPLTEADLMGLMRGDLALEVPWSQNRVRRPPAAAQGPGWLESVEVSSGEDFARALFTFSDIAFFPGYEVGLMDAGVEVPCGEAGEALALPGDRAIVVRFKPANAHDSEGVRVPVRTRALSPDHLTEGGLVCDLNDNVVWAAGLNRGDQVRVMEFRNPKRLVVDVR